MSSSQRRHLSSSVVPHSMAPRSFSPNHCVSGERPSSSPFMALPSRFTTDVAVANASAAKSSPTLTVSGTFRSSQSCVNASSTCVDTDAASPLSSTRASSNDPNRSTPSNVALIRRHES